MLDASEIHNSPVNCVELFKSEHITRCGIRHSKNIAIAISMDGRGRVFDNIFVERLWRSVKYEEVYLKDYGTVDQARQNLAGYFHFYNYERLHQSLGYLTPAEVYFGYEADFSCSASHSAESLGMAKVTI